MSFHVPEVSRVTSGPLASDRSAGNNGFFQLLGPRSAILRCVASDGTGWERLGFPPPVWEHVSVSLPDRIPTWAEMCYVKRVFWDAEDCVIQFHPPRAEYVNCHPHCLHLWRPVGVEIPRPPMEAVGPRR